MQASGSKGCGACRIDCLRGGIADARRQWFCYTICLCSYHPLPLCQSRSSAAESPSTGALLNAASAAMPHSARSLPPFYRHSRLTLVRRGCKTVTNRRGSWRSHVHRTNTAQRVQSFKRPTANVGGRGGAPRPSLGDLKGVFSSRREYPLCPAPHGRWGPPYSARGAAKLTHLC